MERVLNAVERILFSQPFSPRQTVESSSVRVHESSNTFKKPRPSPAGRSATVFCSRHSPDADRRLGHLTACPCHSEPSRVACSVPHRVAPDAEWSGREPLTRPSGSRRSNNPRRPHVGAGHAADFRDGVEREVDGRVGFPDGFLVRPGHEAEGFAFAEVDVRGVPDDMELVPGLLECIELREELFFRDLLGREAALGLVVSIHEVLHDPPPCGPSGAPPMCFCWMPPVVAVSGPRSSLIGLAGTVFVTPSPPGKARVAGTWDVAL